MKIRKRRKKYKKPAVSKSVCFRCRMEGQNIEADHLKETFDRGWSDGVVFCPHKSGKNDFVELEVHPIYKLNKRCPRNLEHAVAAGMKYD